MTYEPLFDYHQVELNDVCYIHTSGSSSVIMGEVSGIPSKTFFYYKNIINSEPSFEGSVRGEEIHDVMIVRPSHAEVSPVRILVGKNLVERLFNKDI